MKRVFLIVLDSCGCGAMPDSDKIGIWGMGINKIYPEDADVDYYHGE